MRVDVYLAAAGYTPSRKKAQDLIDAGAVKIDGETVKKASASVNETVEHEVVIEQVFPYVSRGGVKLRAALDAFKINVSCKRAVDVGSSTGGFTDCLLQRGASKVIAVDSGTGQLHESLRADPRVRSVEGFNARDISPETIGEICDMAVCDLSFISQTYIIDNVYSVLKDGGIFITLIKPQFECGKEALSKGGIVKDKKQHRKAVEKVLEFAKTSGFSAVDIMRSPIEGGDGNKEFLACFIKNGGLSAVTERKIEEVTR